MAKAMKAAIMPMMTVVAMWVINVKVVKKRKEWPGPLYDVRILLFVV